MKPHVGVITAWHGWRRCFVIFSYGLIRESCWTSKYRRLGERYWVFISRAVDNNLTLSRRDSLTTHATPSSVSFASCHKLILKILMYRKVNCPVHFHPLSQTHLTSSGRIQSRDVHGSFIAQQNAVVTCLFLAGFVLLKVFLVRQQPTLCFAHCSLSLVSWLTFNTHEIQVEANRI